MTGYIVMGIAIAIPVLLGILFRVNTSYLFFSLLSGELLVRYFGDDAELVLGSFIKGDAAKSYGELAVLILPMLLTAIFLKGTMSKGKVILHIVPLLVTGIIFAAFALPLLPVEVQAQIRATEWGRKLLDSSDMIIGVMVLLQLVALWITNRPHHDKHAKHGKHH